MAIRVATYNLYLGADLGLLFGARDGTEHTQRLAEVLRQLDVTAFPKRVDAVARLLTGARPDLVGLQEVCTWHADGTPLWDFEAALLAALDRQGEPYDVVATVPTFTGSASVLGTGPLRLVGANTVLRRRSSRTRVESADHGTFAASHRLDDGASIGVDVVRGWCSVQARDAEDRPFVLVDTHTEAYDAPARDAQRDELLGVLDRWTDRPVVLVGDFNATPEEVGMPSTFEDAWVVAGHGEGWTCGQAGDLSNPASGLSHRIDYVWVRDARVTGARLLGAEQRDRSELGLWPSDHAAVVADVELP